MPLAFFAGDADMARLFRHHDWSDSPLGPPEQWPQSLRSVVQLMLGSAFPMFAQEKSALDRSDGGLGIGLALSRGLVELHGGTLSAYSEGPGRGSRLVVRLPMTVQAREPGAVSQIEAMPVIPVQVCSVLLADDKRDSADTLAELLRMEGHQVYTAHDGIHAAALALERRPDVMVLDIGMPGLNGYEVARQVRAQS